jgi:stearoyl-CoA desaturase (delta-9 desaturase)
MGLWRVVARRHFMIYQEQEGGATSLSIARKKRAVGVSDGFTGPIIASQRKTARLLTVILTVALPFCGLVAAIALSWGRGVGITELALLLVMYLITALGVSLGSHRLFTHRSFQAKKGVRLALAIAGSMANQGRLFEWVAFHRIHHQRTDREGDPHSPHAFGVGLWNQVRGAWHAHIGWLFKPSPEHLSDLVDDLRVDRSLVAVDRSYHFWSALGLLLPALAGWFIRGTPRGFFFGLLWGGLVRSCLFHHVSWSINSVCHLWGSRPFKTGDMSTNNAIFALIGVGEGWHNNHHAFPSSARHGLKWWEFDFPYLLLRLLKSVGLVWDLKAPTIEAQKRKSI